MRDAGGERMMAASLAGAAWGETGDEPAPANDTFRQAMRGVAATVNIVTICVDGRPMGMTATAMSSVSMDPPSLLVCINACLTMHDPMEDVAHFCVNVLHGGQQELARIFADPARKASRFLDGWLMDGNRPPRLAEAQAAMLCRRIGHHRFGTHSIFIGVVEEVWTRDGIDPLVYLDGRYAGIAG
jgi:flavin reductase (DIM6/NTAB) family NADH-FMN oxidoreductase RutF